MTTTGPFLYDEGPEPLHTGTPRRSGKYLVLIFGATALVAILMVVLLPLVRGSAGDQSREVVQVFLAALDKGDTETAHQLLCEKERADLKPDDVAARYVVGGGPGKVVSASDAKADGAPAQQVRVRWSDGSASRFTVVNSDGPHVCGVTRGG
jgi:cell division septation protein DedD